ncbi:DUF6680 family protein [Maricaulis sp.]|uniref:DUF6680 family protein n=1 Tax=Maricaulis sp. TaxID=1486257 RepID=UPI003A8FB90D
MSESATTVALGAEFWVNTALLVLTLFAIIVGPIAAVLVSRSGEQRRQKAEARLEVFRALMKTRSVRMNADHVWALNLIELEFYQFDDVIKKYRAYIRHLNSPTPEEADQQERYFSERSDLYSDLLQAVGMALGYHFDKRDLDRSGYAPVGWLNDEDLQRNNARLINEMLLGRRAIPIAHLSAPIDSPFPPAPD